MRTENNLSVTDFEPSTATFQEDVLAGLKNSPKTLPCKYFYDERGCMLFDEICELEEYYLTRTELEIMRQYAPAMARAIGRGAHVIEFGSGSGTKTRLLLNALARHAPAVAYTPVDIARDHLDKTSAALSQAYESLEILPICADFTEHFEVSEPQQIPASTVVYFPGSTIGNFTPMEASRLLESIAELCGDKGGLLLGIDLQKDPQIIEKAYNDDQGVTDQFNLNLLQRINNELDGNFNLDQFKHKAVYNQQAGRMEIEIISTAQQTVTVAGESFFFSAGEGILTEYSHKYTRAGLAEIARESGLRVSHIWTDPRQYFGVAWLTRQAATNGR